MLVRGDRQHDIAAYFGVNGGRIAEVSSGDNPYPNATPAPPDQLPTPGPYLCRYAMRGVLDAFAEAIEALDLAKSEQSIDDMKAALALARSSLASKLEHLKEV
jgi:predicted dehydrogenase